MRQRNGKNLRKVQMAENEETSAIVVTESIKEGTKYAYVIDFKGITLPESVDASEVKNLDTADSVSKLYSSQHWYNIVPRRVNESSSDSGSDSSSGSSTD